MLRFEKHPDTIFTAILDKAFNTMISELSDTSDYTKEELAGGVLQYYMAYAKRNFTDDTILPVLQELVLCNLDQNFWNINDYHYLVIYDTLRYFCGVENDFAKESGEPILCVGDREIYELDFETLVDLYFWDDDFLIPEEHSFKIGIEGRRQLGMTKEIFGIAEGLQPHPDEMKINLLEKGNFIPLDPDPMFFKAGSTCYPDYYTDDVER